MNPQYPPCPVATTITGQFDLARLLSTRPNALPPDPENHIAAVKLCQTEAAYNNAARQKLVTTAEDLATGAPIPLTKGATLQKALLQLDFFDCPLPELAQVEKRRVRIHNRAYATRIIAYLLKTHVALSVTLSQLLLALAFSLAAFNAAQPDDDLSDSDDDERNAPCAPV